MACHSEIAVSALVVRHLCKDWLFYSLLRFQYSLHYHAANWGLFLGFLITPLSTEG